MGERQYVYAVEPSLAPANQHKGIGDLTVALPQGANLRPGKHDTRLKRLLDEVIVARRAVARDLLNLALAAFGPCRLGHGLLLVYCFSEAILDAAFTASSKVA